MRWKNEAERYATAVLEILHTEFEIDDADATHIHQCVQRHASTRGITLEVIVDRPGIANWRLTAIWDQPGRVRLGCYRYPTMITDADQQREDRINQQLENL